MQAAEQQQPMNQQKGMQQPLITNFSFFYPLSISLPVLK
jgi:hypothetical protein